jgi:hypothetical protein
MDNNAPVKAVLEFDLTDVQGRQSFEVYSKAQLLLYAIYDFRYDVLRSMSKYEYERVNSMSGVDIVDEITDKFFNILTQYGISLDSLCV